MLGDFTLDILTTRALAFGSGTPVFRLGVCMSQSQPSATELLHVASPGIPGVTGIHLHFDPTRLVGPGGADVGSRVNWVQLMSGELGGWIRGDGFLVHPSELIHTYPLYGIHN